MRQYRTPDRCAPTRQDAARPHSDGLRALSGVADSHPNAAYRMPHATYARCNHMRTALRPCEPRAAASQSFVVLRIWPCAPKLALGADRPISKCHHLSSTCYSSHADRAWLRKLWRLHAVRCTLHAEHFALYTVSSQQHARPSVASCMRLSVQSLRLKVSLLPTPAP
jgi:hypothetical protein